jgi:PKHD-type hydroxylase
MKGEWCYFKSFFDKDTCEKIIRDAQILPVQDAMVGLGNTEVVHTQSRRSKIRFISDGDWRFQYVFDALWKNAIRANEDFFGVHITRLNFIQLAEYDSSYQGEYKDHHDVFWLNDDPTYHRKLSAIIQLSDPNSYEGGDFVMTDAKYPIDPDVKEQGTFAFFPSMMRHRANPVTRGTRYSIAAWFEGPKWR